MHELGVVVTIVDQVEGIMEAQGLEEVDTLVLAIGELSSMVPHYVEACFPAAVDGTRLARTKLVLEVLPAEARCRACGDRFRPRPPHSDCPRCSSPRTELLSGKEFLIKELVAR